MVYLTVYLVGAVFGLLVMRDRWPARIAIAALWPLGPLAFVVVVTILLASAVYLWPVPALATAAVLAAIWLVS